MGNRIVDTKKRTMEELREITGKEDVHFLKLDLGDIKASKSAAEELVKFVHLSQLE